MYKILLPTNQQQYFKAFAIIYNKHQYIFQLYTYTKNTSTHKTLKYY